MALAQDQFDGKFFGVPISIKGLNMVVFLALVAVTSYTIYYLSQVVSSEHQIISHSINAQTEAVKQLTEVQKEQNYILLADDAETDRIRRAYRMPPSLRGKLLGNEEKP